MRSVSERRGGVRSIVIVILEVSVVECRWALLALFLVLVRWMVFIGCWVRFRVVLGLGHGLLVWEG